MRYKNVLGCIAIVILCLVSFWLGRHQSDNNNDGEAGRFPGYADARKEDVLLGIVFGGYVDSHRDKFPSIARSEIPAGIVIESAGNRDWTKEEKLRFIFSSLITMRLDGEAYNKLAWFAGDDSDFIAEELLKLDEDELSKFFMLSAEQLEYIRDTAEYIRAVAPPITQGGEFSARYLQGTIAAPGVYLSPSQRIKVVLRISAAGGFKQAFVFRTERDEPFFYIHDIGSFVWEGDDIIYAVSSIYGHEAGIFRLHSVDELAQVLVKGGKSEHFEINKYDVKSGKLTYVISKEDEKQQIQRIINTVNIKSSK